MATSKNKTIAILRLSSLGDIIHTVPAFALLRQNHPFLKIIWIVEPAGSKLLNNFTGIDEIFTINLKKKGIWKKIKELRRLISHYRNRIDLIIDFQGLLKSAIVSFFLKSYSIGFNKKVKELLDSYAFRVDLIFLTISAKAFAAGESECFTTKGSPLSSSSRILGSIGMVPK